MFNNCIDQGIFPSILKIGQIVPIYKSGKKDQCSNYRPISLLNPLSKIFEKCLHERLYSYFDKYKILTPHQFGFKQNSSTSEAVRLLYDEFAENIDNKKSTCSVFLDLKKAFDTVNHNILLQKLGKYGIRGLPLQLLQNYLTNRYQYTVINHSKSEYCPITCGVPQGSTLGPLLFLIYVNDLPLASNKINTKLFADDTVLTISHKCIKNLNNNMNEELHKIDNWMKINKLSLNYNKTKCMLITTQKSQLLLDISIGNHSIEQVSSLKYLGVIFDDKLCWKQHIQHICSKLSSGSWALLRLRNYVSLSTLKMVYYSLVYSHLQYCITTWGLAAANALDPLEKLHKRIVRIITKSPYQSHTTPLFYRLNLLKLNDICQFELAKCMYKINKNPNSNVKNQLLLTKSAHSHNTRHSAKDNYYLPKKRTEIGKKSFDYTGPKVWQDVPHQFKSCSFHVFKKRMKKHMISKYSS